MNFESLRHEISHHVHAANDPLSAPRLLEICQLAQDKTQLANCLYTMCQADELTKHPAPEGSGTGVRFLYGPGKNKPGAEAPRENAARAAPKGKARRRKAKGKPAAGPSAKGKKRSRAVRKVQRRRAVLRVMQNDRSVAAAAPIWSVGDGRLFCIAGDAVVVSIERDTARGVIELVRRHGTAPFAALQVFVEKLDKAGI